MIFDCGGKPLDLTRPRVMGVLNLTPDSFSDGGLWEDPEAAFAHAQAMADAGAAIIDVGGESTRPGAAPVDAESECVRVVPVIERLAKSLSIPISIDTSKPEVMRAAVAAGAGLINDVRALREPGALAAASETGVPVCLMHMLGEPRTMQQDPRYDDVVAEVRAFLRERVAACEAAGIPHSRILVDPGFGFGKTLAHNTALLARLGEIVADGLPVLVGVSRKAMIGALTGRGTPAGRVAGSVAAATLAANFGARLLRVHDVAQTVEALAVVSALLDQQQEG